MSSLLTISAARGPKRAASSWHMHENDVICSAGQMVCSLLSSSSNWLPRRRILEHARHEVAAIGTHTLLAVLTACHLVFVVPGMISETAVDRGWYKTKDLMVLMHAALLVDKGLFQLPRAAAGGRWATGRPLMPGKGQMCEAWVSYGTCGSTTLVSG